MVNNSVAQKQSEPITTRFVIDELTESEAALRARVQDIQSDRDSYRDLALVSIGHLAEQTDLVRKLTAHNAQLLDENRAVWEQIRREAA
jgi:hypothetical protein